MSADTPPQERRRYPRRRTLYRGTVTHSERAVTIECVVRDIAPGGARIELTTELPVPELFELSVPQLEFTHRPVRLRWSRGRDLGVVFLDAQPPPNTQAGSDAGQPAPAAGLSLSERVAKLEHDLARLQRQFAEFRLEAKRHRGEGD